MHTVSFWRGSVVAIIFLLSACVPLFSFAAVGIDPQIPFSGTLKDEKGKILNGEYRMEFRIYDVSTGGGALWSETFSNVSVSDGAFSVMLGSTTPLTSVNFNQALYLGVKIGTDPEMVPRERLGASAYAFNADLLDGLDSSVFIRENQLVTDLQITNATATNFKVSTLVDSNNSFGLSGYVLQSVNNLAQWVATSSLGFGAGTVTSIGLTAPAGFSVSNSPITESGILALSYAAGYEGLLIASSTNWNGFYDVPSTRITNGNGLSWNSNTLDCLTADSTTLGCLNSMDWISFNNKVSSTSIDASNEIAAIIADETGTGSLVFSENPLLAGFRSNASSTIGDGTNEGGLTVFGGLRTTGDMQVDGSFTLSSNTDIDSIFALTQTGAGDIMNVWSGADKVFTILNDGSLGFTTFSDEVQTADGKGIRLGNSDGGISLYVDTLLNLDKNVLMLEAYGDAYSDSVDITASSSLSFTANAFNLDNQYDPSFSLGGDGFVTLTSSQSFDINALGGVQILSGGLTLFEDATSTFWGPLEALSGERSVFDAGIETGVGSVVLVGDQSQVRFGTISEALTLSYDFANPNNFLFGLDNIPGGQSYLNLITPGEMRFVSNGADGTNPELTIVAGKVGIGNTNPQEALDVTGTILATGLDVVGIITASTTVMNDIALDVYGAISVSNLSDDLFGYALESDVNGVIKKGDPVVSDRKFKENIQTIDNALDTLLNLRGVRYEWKNKEQLGAQTEIGFIAQEVQEVVPEVVRDNGDYLSINTKNIIAIVVEAIKELNTKVEGYFTRTERLEREVADLRREIDALKGGSSLDANSEEGESVSVSVPEEVISPAPVEEVVVDPAPAAAPESIVEPVLEPEIPYVAE